jgi:periplasmic mercuric ion binding protein
MHMNKLAVFVTGLTLMASSSVIAAERTITLAVQNMYCAACPHTVRASLQAVPGVENVTVSLQQKTAVVMYDDSRTDVKALSAATTNADYPSSPKS